MKIGVFSTFMSPNATPGMIRDFGRKSEDLGLDSIWMGEHVALFEKNTFGYPGSKDGRIPVPPGGGMLDVTATFGFLAAATTKLRFGTGVALVPQRNPIYTAKEICTLDWLTEGRIDFGIGVGWNKEEVEACGYNIAVHGQKGFNGVAILSKTPLEDVRRGLPGEPDDLETGIGGTVGGQKRRTVVGAPVVDIDDLDLKFAFQFR